MSRLILKILCIASGALFAALAIFLAISTVQVLSGANAASIGIIGGADGPTAIFLTGQIMRTSVFSTMIVAFLLFSVTGLVLLITKKSKN